MSRKIKIVADYYCTEYAIYNSDSVEIKPGITALCGCNGAGKSTLLHQIKGHLDKNKVPVYDYDDVSQGGLHCMNTLLFQGQMDLLAQHSMSSEGEGRLSSFSYQLGSIKHFIENAEVKNILRLSSNKKYDKNIKERWVLVDATTSGLSIDVIDELFEVFNLMKMTANECSIDLYIVIGCNEYETVLLADNRIDVQNLVPIEFSSYLEYREFILSSRKNKDNRVKIEYLSSDDIDSKVIPFIKTLRSNNTIIDDIDSLEIMINEKFNKHISYDDVEWMWGIYKDGDMEDEDEESKKIKNVFKQ